MISFGRGVCDDFAAATELEWLETNGRGGYAMGTVSGSNTRRYHGFMTIALRPPVERFQVLNRLEESILLNGERHEMSCQVYPGAVYPQGFKNLERFRLDPFPVWTYAMGDVRLEKSFFFRYGEDTAVILYENLSGPEVVLDVRPILTCRNHHHVTKEDDRFAGRLDIQTHRVKVKTLAGPDVFLVARDGTFSNESFWYRNQQYALENQRGLDFREDAFSPGVFKFTLKPGQSAALVVSTAERCPGDPRAWARQERAQRQQVLDKSLVRGPLADGLIRAADQFLVSRDGGTSVIAGYPWFEDWGRDSMVSLPGLCLALGRHEEAGEILDTFAKHVRHGLLPNRFPEDHPSADYNAADPSLWFIWAVQKYFQATQDAERVRRLLPVMREIVDAYQHGAVFGIRMDQDGLIIVPSVEHGFTWMDARVNGAPVTPRSGKPVEIQALWYNALQFLAELDLKFNEPSRGYEKLAAIARNSFNEKFWNEEAGYLYDRVDGREKDASIRPNALIAISLPYEVLAENRFRAVVDLAWRELYTPYGLRTLASSDPSYRGTYDGTAEDRDAAYHQGNAWTWLLGSFLTSYVKAYGSSEETKAKIQSFLDPFRKHLLESGLGNVSELFEGNPPHAPRGCPAQAWSVAEILRVLWEENILV